ncbi:hypothetical protein [uncultured Phascolarctobacterium sp.]|uniref:hypothetical protein n=1 Tax=uncultured Phascolarctobacterium sp. TaxID=512296 RepID=UPI00258D8185|nr:hypothetical protein [uncultured Phascolarctobacterium sp.]
MKKTLLTAGIILAACLPSFSSEASNNIIPTPSRNSYYQNVSSYTNITLGMADRERKEQEAWDREKNGAAKNMNPTSKNAGTVNAGNVRKRKNAQRKTVTIKKTKNVRMTVILNVSANGNSTLLNREEKVTDSRNQKRGS